MLACEENCNFATQIGVFACNQVMSHILIFFLIIPRCKRMLLAIFENRCAPLHLFSKCFFTREIISLNSDNYQSAFISDVL